MEHRTQIDKERGLVVDVIRGEVTVEELRDKFISLFSNPDYDDSMRGLCDLRQATSRMNRSDFEQLADELDSSGEFGKARWAILTEDPILTAFSQIFQRHVGEGGKIQVFSTLEAAEEFIGIRIKSGS
jgi:hypothetical protein